MLDFPSIFSRPEKHSTTEESLKRARHYHTGIAAKRKRLSVDLSITRLCCHRSGGGQLSFCAAGGRTAPSIVCPFIIPVWFSPLLHSSISPFISPSISSYRLLLHMWIHLSRAGRRLQVHIHTSQPSVSAGFSNIG